jgi:hypothetical protein
VAGGFAAAARGMIVGRSRKELEANTLRNGFWGGLGGIILFGGGLLLRHSEAGVQAVVVVAFVVGLTMLEVLDDRDRRRTRGHR